MRHRAIDNMRAGDTFVDRFHCTRANRPAVALTVFTTHASISHIDSISTDATPTSSIKDLLFMLLPPGSNDKDADSFAADN